MRAAASTSEEPWLAVTTLPDPTPGPGDLVLRVDACGICGSDLHMAHSLRRHPGVVFGHEIAGTVVGTGTEVTGWREGDRVVGFPVVGCGECTACLAGAVTKCARSQLVGAQLPGAYAELVAVRAAEALALPDALSSDLGALVEPLAVAHHALDKTPRSDGEPVLVLGGGPVGLAVALWAQALGARHVVVSDPVAGRRELAQSLGALAVDPADDVAAQFADLTGSRPRAVVECIGRPGAIEHAVDVAAVDAHVTLVGACTKPDTFRPIVATSKELALQFVVYYSRSDFSATIGALEAGTLDAAPLVTGHVDLDGLPDRFSALVAGTTSDVKVLITP